MYIVVENCVKNAWSRFGLRTMMNFKWIFFFKFNSNTGTELILENGPWLICNVPLILRYWSPLVNVSKKDLKSLSVWVKLHVISITPFTEDGLSVISTKLGTSFMLDTYTTSMCMESWGRSNFGRAMIDLHADVELKDTLVVPTPFDVLNMVEKDVGVAPSDSINSIGDDVNVESSKDVKLDNEDNDRENDVEEEGNETGSFMALKSSKGSSSSKNEGGTGRKNLYVRWKDDYDDNVYDDDVEGENLTEEQLPFYDAYDIDALEDKKQLQRFLEVLTYAETYIEKLAKMRKPLQGKLKKDVD
nr:hypothetical protein [Tanacetum cinerariifolium]